MEFPRSAKHFNRPEYVERFESIEQHGSHVHDWLLILSNEHGRLPAAERCKDFLHLFFAAAHDDRRTIENPPDAKTAEGTTALVATQCVGVVTEKIGLSQFELSDLGIHGSIVSCGVPKTPCYRSKTTLPASMG